MGSNLGLSKMALRSSLNRADNTNASDPDEFKFILEEQEQIIISSPPEIIQQNEFGNQE